MGDQDHVETRGTSKGRFYTNVRASYDKNFKIMVINYAVKTNNCAAAVKYGISEVNVRRWKKQYEQLKSCKSTRKSFSGPKHGRFQEIEKQVVDFVKVQRANGMPISCEAIQYKAREIAKTFNLTQRDFKASRGWCVRMMRRNGFCLRRRTSLCQKLPADFEEKLVAYQRYIIRLRTQNDYLLGQMGNADETPVYFDMPTNYTVDIVGTKTVSVKTTGNEKMRVTVMLTVLADGRKLPPFIILNRKTMPKEKLPTGLIVRCQEKGWMNSELMQDWLKVVWGRRPGALLKKRGMLVLDAFKGHLTPEVKSTIQDMNTDLVVIPGGMTSKLQVLDVCINKPFKDNLRLLYSEWLLAGNHALTPTGKIKKPSVTVLCQWIKAAWDKVSPEVIIKGFKKCCISNAMDGSEDSVMWEDDDLEAGDSCEDGGSSSESDA